MFVPTLCPTCTAIVIVATSGMIETEASRLFRCPSCRLIGWQATVADPPLTPDGRGPTAAATKRPTGPPTPPAGRP